jgi:hypothetical protein
MRFQLQAAVAVIRQLLGEDVEFVSWKALQLTFS